MSGRRARSLALAAGLAAAAVTVAPPVDAVADRSLSAHMAQHMVLTMVAAPLIMIGSPVSLLLRRLPRPAARRLVAYAERSSWLRVLTAPLLGWGLLSALQLAIYLTPLFELAEQHPLLHAGEHLALFAAALLFWRPIVGADPLRRPSPVIQVVYLLTAMPFSDVIGVWLIASPHVVYPAYAAGGLADQRRAGAVMLAGSFVLGAAALAAAWSWVKLDDRRAVLREQAG